MKRFAVACALLVALHAQDVEPPALQLPPKEAAMDALFSIPATAPELAAAEEEARKHGVPEQTIYEARFLFHVEHKSDKGIIDMLPIWEKQEKVFSLDHSEIFATREDFLAVIEFSRALKALGENKLDDFKKHITEALWLSPGQASAFTPYIESLRLSEHIKNTRVDFAGQVLDLEKQNPIALKSLLGENRALLLHFWSPWSPDCETSMMDLSNVCPSLDKEKVALASILVDGRTEILAEAKDFLKGQDTPLPGPQLLDRSKDSLAAQLRVTDLPTVVLLGTDGKILFHGKPSDEKLLEKIKQLPPQKEQP